MNTKYSHLTESQKLAINNDDLELSLQLEAIDRGIKPPITLSKALEQEGYPTYHTPQEAVFFYEILAPQSYGNPKPSGLAYRTIEEARAALNGALSLYEDGYGSGAKIKIGNAGDFQIVERAVVLGQPKFYSAQIETFYQDNADYEAMVKECMDDLRKVRQSDYDRRVIAEKRANYMRLAQQNEEIAKAFWEKSERTEWPTE